MFFLPQPQLSGTGHLWPDDVIQCMSPSQPAHVPTQVWRLADGRRDVQHLLGGAGSSPWSSSGHLLLAMRLPPQSEDISVGDKLAVGVFKAEAGTQGMQDATCAVSCLRAAWTECP